MTVEKSKHLLLNAMESVQVQLPSKMSKYAMYVSSCHKDKPTNNSRQVAVTAHLDA